MIWLINLFWSKAFFKFSISPIDFNHDNYFINFCIHGEFDFYILKSNNIENNYLMKLFIF